MSQPSSKYMPGIPYLELSDFNSDLSLKESVHQNKPVVVMCQGVFCGYCNMAKPAFMEFAKIVNGKVTACTIQIDSEKELGAKLPLLDKNFQGVPIYLGFNSKGKYVKTHDKQRDVQSLLAFAQELN